MPFNRSVLRAAALAAITVPAVSLPYMAMAQVDPGTLPQDLRSAPVVEDLSETTVDADGVETITRTRRIEYTAPEGHGDVAYPGAHPHGHAPMHMPLSYAPGAVFERDQWIAECERRTSGRNEKEKGGIIGGLLGAITGGIIGNRVADGDRLAGTLIGAGTGGLAGILLGGLVGGGKKNDRYDCEAALDSYLSQYGTGPVRVASRAIPAHAPVYGYPGYAHGYHGYGYGYAPAYSYTYQPPQQVVYVPVRYEQKQRVIVRETVREETYTVPGKQRMIKDPSPKLIKQQPVRVRPAPAPQPSKLIKDQ